MNENYIKVKDLAEQLGMTVSVINIHIGNGKAGQVNKIGEGETKDYTLTLENVNILLKWLRVYGRGNKKKLMETVRKYKELTQL